MNENVNQEQEMTTQTTEAVAENPVGEEKAEQPAAVEAQAGETPELNETEVATTEVDTTEVDTTEVDEDEMPDDDEDMSSEDFEALLNEAEDRTLTRVSAGQKIEGRVVAISGEVAYVDIGMRSEASLAITEDPRFESIKEGDAIPVFVANPSGQIELSLDPIMGKGDISVLEKAYSTNEQIEGKVNALMSGGYEVNVAGVRCFCPHSQIALRGVAEPASMVGESYNFKVIDLDVRKKNVVLSRRVILDEARKQELEKIREKLVVGAVLKGTVRDIQRFGAFVDLGGIQGLLHISQLSYQNVEKVESVVSVGEELEVKLLDITTDNRGKERISLSLKALQPNPWDTLNLEEGQMITGRVARKSQFGVFVNIAPAVDGLLPRRMMKKAGQHVSIDSFTEGEEIEVEVVDINLSDRKIALALPGWDEVIKSALREGDLLKAEVIKILPVGVLVKGLEDPARGLLHKRHLKFTAMKQIVDAFPIGAHIDVALQEIDSQGRFNFVLPQEADAVDRKTISEFSEKDGLGHNPFASFFKQD